MKKIIFLWLFMGFILPIFAQDDSDYENALTEIEGVKTALITKKLQLSNEQAPKFWLIYNAFSTEKQAIRREIMQLHKGIELKGDPEVKKDLYKILDLKQKEVDLERKYFEKFQEVLSFRQIHALHKAEKEFKRMLLQRLNKNAKE